MRIDDRSESTEDHVTPCDCGVLTVAADVDGSTYAPLGGFGIYVASSQLGAVVSDSRKFSDVFDIFDLAHSSSIAPLKEFCQDSTVISDGILR
jgi:hypothetical protein